MANPRQRRKARSSSYRPVSHSKNAKRKLKKNPPIRGPKALQEAWDKGKTVRQNYARLGLAASLDPSANGGVEKILGQSTNTDSQLATSSSSSSSSSSLPSEELASKDKDLPTGFGRIIRDDSGNIIRVELNADEEPPSMRLDPEDIDNVESRIDPEVRQRWVHGFTKNTIGVVVPQDGTLIKELEYMSTSASGATKPRPGVGSQHVFSGGLKYMQPLVKKYGGNVKSMASDLKLNPEQKTLGELRRLLRKAGLPIQD